MNTYKATVSPENFIGDNGFDFVDYSDATFNPNSEITGVTVSLSASGPTPTGTFAVGDTFTDIDGFIGSAFNDLLDGNADNNELRGGAGDDLLFGDAGADTLDGGTGIDGAFYLSNIVTEGATVNLADQTQNARGALGDVLISIENLHGSVYDDDFTGDSGTNVLEGRQGDDRLNGGGGNDFLYGNEGQDSLDGGAGYDTAVYSGPSSAFQWVRNDDGSWTVTDSRSGMEGTDILRGVEALSFDDRAFGLPGSEEAVDIFRFYNTKTKSHFFTSSDAERQYVVDNYKQFRFEGNAFDTTATADTGLSVHRFYNTKTKTHFYTASDVERQYVLDHYKQFRYEGVSYYGYSDDQNGAHIPLYRFYNTQTKTHFYTVNEAEKSHVLADLDQFRYEGIAYYVDLA